MADVEFTAYHGTCSRHRQSIERFGFSPGLVTYRNDHWLGQGVYFFELEDLAIWWANDLSRKLQNRGTSPLVYACDISVNQDQYIDLDDSRSLDKFWDYCIDLIETINEDTSIPKKPIFTDQKLRAILFDYYKNENNIFVIAYTFKKSTTTFAKKRSYADLKLLKTVGAALDLGYKERQICVSSKDCLGPPTLVYSEDGEVI